MKKVQTVPITCKVSYIQGDATEYMQRSVELEPQDLQVVIQLPLKKKYFADPRVHDYWASVTVAETTGDKVVPFETPSPIILTVKGLAETRRLVNEAFSNAHPYSKNYEEDEELKSHKNYNEF
ncbi:MAG: hypothetical protein ACXAC2_13750 [Candidatus Kariarchaeaceae archaeon]|jgi:hypothetical protein